MPQIRFDAITDSRYDSRIRAKMSDVISRISDVLQSDGVPNRQAGSTIVRAINCIACMYMVDDSPPDNWSYDSPLINFPTQYQADAKNILKTAYIEPKSIDWSDYIRPVSSNTVITSIQANPEVTVSVSAQAISHTEPSPISSTTDKSDLYIQPPTVPQFDVNRVWRSGVTDGIAYTIYCSCPDIPTKQNEISCTTNLTSMSNRDLLRLYPKSFIRTRAACMYESTPKIELHPTLGLILPIDHYTRAQLIDNIIKYPHIFKLLRDVDGEVESFYSRIEIDGELYEISDVWNQLPESEIVPYTREFVKEYVVRRYLLERDIRHIKHRYNTYGTLDPFLTLFTTPDDYAHLGYTDSLELARQCVRSRVSYKQSRNPVLRRLSDA